MEYHPENVPEVDDLEELVLGGDEKALCNFLALLQPADMAVIFDRLPRDLWPKVVAPLNIAQISDLMEELPDHLRDDLAELLSPNQLTSAFEEMASDGAADVIADLPRPLAKKVLKALPAEDRREVETLLKYPEDTAGGLMQIELVSVLERATVDEAVEAIRANAEEAGDLHFVYVVDDDNRLVGSLSLEQLILARSDTSIGKLVDRDFHCVTTDVDQEEVARMFRRYDLVSLPVVGDQGTLLGRILHDDALDVLEEEVDEDILRMAGAEEPELVYTDQILKIAWVRMPWLISTLLGLTIPALLTRLFQITFPYMATLVPFVLVIGAMGGNIGTQSATIVVRGFATGRVDFDNLGRFLYKETIVSFIIGITCGIIAGAVAILWQDDAILGLTVAISMTAAIIISAILGVLVPYLFRLIKIDPAVAAGPTVTTINDIVAIGIYYLVALSIVA